MVYWKSRNERWGVHIYITDGWTRRKFRTNKVIATQIWPELNNAGVTRSVSWMDVMLTITTPR